MGHHHPSLSSSCSSLTSSSCSSLTSSSSSLLDLDSVPGRLECPFGRLDSLSHSELRATAYELFFVSCRAISSGSTGSSGPLGRPPSGPHSLDGPGVEESGTSKGGNGLMVANSRLKKVLGLKARRGTQLVRSFSQSARSPNSPGRAKRPMTSAEIMRQQMRVLESGDYRLRKTFTRTLLGYVGRKTETMVLPFELLRLIKPSEFNDTVEYKHWQQRQLKVLETGLLIHPSPLSKPNIQAANRLREIIRATETKPLDTSKNSESMRTLSDAVSTLAMSNNSASPNACHWADGYPLNVLMYIILLQSIFDLKEMTVVLDEVDELLELMKKTWPTLRINRGLHNLCLTWVFFHQYVETGETEPDLLSATVAMMNEVVTDAKRADYGAYYMKALSSVLTMLLDWSEHRVVDYHEEFGDGAGARMEHTVGLALATNAIAAGIFLSNVSMASERESGISKLSSTTNPIDYYIKSSMRNAFTRILETGATNYVEGSILAEVDEDPSEVLIRLAKAVEELALVEKEKFSPVLKKFHPVPTAAAVMTLHSCFHLVLRQYTSKVSSLTNELARVLQSAGKMEKTLIQMVAEDSTEYEQSRKGAIREMDNYKVDGLVMSLFRTWIEERMVLGNEYLMRAKETETWMPRSKTEPYAQSAVDLMRLAKLTMDDFFEFTVSNSDQMLLEITSGFADILQEYTAFIASCGSKQSYIPTLPPLTRCNNRSHLIKLWQKAMPSCAYCGSSTIAVVPSNPDPDHPRPSTSRGTQRLYIRLNTLHYVLANLTALTKSLSLLPRTSPSTAVLNAFQPTVSAVEAAVYHVAEVAAYRLIFLDSNHSFYNGLYVGDVSIARIRPALRTLKQNMTLLLSILVDRAGALAMKEVMRAAFEAFLMVVLAGGPERAFLLSDHEMVARDLKGLKRAFCKNGEGVVAEEVVEREASAAQGVVQLMGMDTQSLIEELKITASEGGLGGLGPAGRKIPMPPTTGRWSRADPNTILRVLCYRNEEEANVFLRDNFQLARRQ